MDNYELHAIIIKKPITFENAKKISDEILKNKNKRFYRETKTSFRFRNISKQKFLKSKFRTKKLNKNVSLIFGELKPEYLNLKGSGFSDWFNKGLDAVKTGIEKVKEQFTIRHNYNNVSSRTLKEYGDLPIKSLYIARTPIMSILNNALNLLTLGKWNKNLKENSVDKLFHLQLVAEVGNKKVVMEKNEVININTEFKNSKDTEILEVPLKGKSLTINQMLNNAETTVGNDKWWSYDAFTNNCQWFIRYILEYNGLYDKAEADFLFQDLTKITSDLPSYVSKLSKGLTTTASIFNRILGKGGKFDKLNKNQLKEVVEHYLEEKHDKLNKNQLLEKLNNHFFIEDGKLYKK